MKKAKNSGCFTSGAGDSGCCTVASIVTVDERGQMVLPKEVRKKAKIKSGDKLALVSWEKDGEVCCLSLLKAEAFAEMVKGLLGPMMQNLTRQS